MSQDQDRPQPFSEAAMRESRQYAEAISFEAKPDDFKLLRSIYDHAYPGGTDLSFYSAVEHALVFGVQPSPNAVGIPSFTPGESAFHRAVLELVVKATNAADPNHTTRFTTKTIGDVTWQKVTPTPFLNHAARALSTVFTVNMARKSGMPNEKLGELREVCHSGKPPSYTESEKYYVPVIEAALPRFLEAAHRQSDGSLILDADEIAQYLPYFMANPHTLAGMLNDMFGKTLNQPLGDVRIQDADGTQRPAVLVTPENEKLLLNRCHNVVRAAPHLSRPGLVPRALFSMINPEVAEKAPTLAKLLESLNGAMQNSVVQGKRVVAHGYICPESDPHALREALALINPYIADQAKVEGRVLRLEPKHTETLKQQIQEVAELYRDAPEKVEERLTEMREANPIRKSGKFADKAGQNNAAGTLAKRELEDFTESLLPLQIVHGLIDRVATPDTKRGDKYMSSKSLHLLECSNPEEAHHVAAVLKVFADKSADDVQVAQDEPTGKGQREQYGKHGLKFPVAVGFDAATAIAENSALLDRVDVAKFGQDKEAAISARDRALADMLALGIPQDALSGLIGQQRDGRRLAG